MTKAELFELWNKKINPEIYKGIPGGKNTWERIKALPEDAQAHLRGENVPWPRDICLYWPSKYPEFIIAELEGENGDLALRMLNAYNKMTGRSLLCSVQGDIKGCKALGKTFSDIVNQYCNISEFSRLPEALGLGTVEHYPAEAEAYVKEELASACTPGKKIAKGHSKNRKLAEAILYMALGLIKKDTGRYSSFTKTIEDYCTGLLYDGKGKIKDREDPASDEVTTVFDILCRYHELSPKLNSILRDCMLQGDINSFIGISPPNSEGIRFSGSGEDEGALEAFCKRAGVPDYIVPLMVASGDAKAPGKLSTPKYMEKLFDENRKLFVETYRALLKYDRVSKFYHVFNVLNLMLKKAPNDGEVLALKEEFLKRFPEFMLKLIEKFLQDNTQPYRRRDYLSAQLSLYEYIPSLADNFDATLAKQRAAREARTANNYIELIQAYFKGHAKTWIPSADAEGDAEFLLKRNALKVGDILDAYVNLDAYKRGDIPSAVITGLVKKYPGETEAYAAFLASGTGAPADGIVDFIKLAFAGTGLDGKCLVPFLAGKSKNVVRLAEKFLKEREAEVRETLEALRPKLKGNGALAARRLIKQWDTEKAFGKDFVFSGKEALASYCTLNFDGEAQKLIEWIPADLYSKVRYADMSGPSDRAVAGSLLSEYLFLDEPTRLPICDKIAQGLHGPDLAEAMQALYELWLSSGGDTKKKMILAPCCIYGSDTFILSQKKQIEDWTKHSRGAIASFLVYCMALNGGSVALLTIDGYTVRAPNNQVKNTAKEAFAFAARELGVTEDELSDRIVPDFGFDIRGEKLLDYGLNAAGSGSGAKPRQFRLTLENDFSLSIFDCASEKAIKSIPAPGAKDDPVKAAEVKKEFAELKKSLKAVVQNQTKRLERILMNGRKWTAAAWKKLFVENPVMHRFALGLVWGVYSDGAKLVQSFRYMEDGSFTTADEEDYTLPDEALITLVYPSELSSIETWKKQLEDYEILQPLRQLASPVLTLGEKDREGKLISRYKGKMTSAGKILGLSKRFDMKRGEIMDGGSYNTFFLEDDYLRIGAVFTFEYLYMGIEMNEEVPLEYLAFYTMNEDGTLPFGWGDSIEEGDALDPAEVPPRYLSSMLGIFDNLLGDED